MSLLVPHDAIPAERNVGLCQVHVGHEGLSACKVRESFQVKCASKSSKFELVFLTTTWSHVGYAASALTLRAPWDAPKDHCASGSYAYHFGAKRQGGRPAGEPASLRTGIRWFDQRWCQQALQPAPVGRLVLEL